MASYQDQIKELQEELKNTPYNKATQHHIGRVKAKIAKLKEKEFERSASKSGAKEGYSVRRTGDGTVLLLGFPSTGKSTLLNAITNANSEVGSYAFTTLTVVPGLMDYNFAKIQILDVPGVIQGAAAGRGRGREVLSVIRNADLVLIVLDGTQPEQVNTLLSEVHDSGIRLDKKKPIIKIKKTSKDGVNVGFTKKQTHIDKKTIITVLKEFKINNAEVVIRDNITVDDIIDAVEDNKKYLPSLIAVNKSDMLSDEQKKQLKKDYKPDIFISAKNKDNIEALKKLIFKKLRLIRIYLKEPQKPADLEEPLIMFKDSTIKDVCNKLHKDFLTKFKFSKVWGKSAKFEGQRLMLKHRLIDGDVLEIHLR
ncbi:GTP-binding protein [Candidatus Woesearchaeota archaeon]|nr:GTP-binding protein [Candidatus Woesearchaeota archaeon]